MGNSIARIGAWTSAIAAGATIAGIAVAIVAHAIEAYDVADVAGECAYFALLLAVVASLVAGAAGRNA